VGFLVEGTLGGMLNFVEGTLGALYGAFNFSRGNTKVKNFLWKELCSLAFPLQFNS